MARMSDDRILEYLNSMAGSYKKGVRRSDDVLELRTSDTGKTYRVHLMPDECRINDGDTRPATASIETTADDFIRFTEGRLNPVTALLRRLVKVKGDIGLIKELPRYFDLGK